MEEKSKHDDPQDELSAEILKVSETLDYLKEQKEKGDGPDMDTAIQAAKNKLLQLESLKFKRFCDENDKAKNILHPVCCSVYII